MTVVRLTKDSIIEHGIQKHLEKRLVSHPSSTFVFDLGNSGIAVVDRDTPPKDGDLLLIGTGQGFEMRRMRPQEPQNDIWGVVTWLIQRP